MVTEGEGPAVYLIHGFPQSWYEWRHLIEALAVDHFVIAPDLRGMGESAPCTEGQDKRTLAADARHIQHALGVDRAVMIGHDWGGGVTTRYVLDYPRHSRALVNMGMFYLPTLPVDEYFSFDQLRHSWYMFVHQDRALPERLAEAAGETYLRWFFEHGAGRRGCPLSDADLAEYVRTFKGAHATAQFNLYRTMFAEDREHWAADAGRVSTLPTLWISGSEDPWGKREYNRLLPAAFDHLRIEVFEGCGHWIPEEEPERLASLIREFLHALPAETD